MNAPLHMQSVERRARRRRTCRQAGRIDMLAALAREDKGSEAVEIAIIFPVVMVFLLLGFQVALWGLAAHALELAVAEGGAAARSQSGGVAQGVSTVVRDVRAIAGGAVGSLQVQARAQPHDFVAVSASGAVPTVFPGLQLHVFAQSSGPEQVFRATG